MDTHNFNESRKRFEPKEKKCKFCKSGSNNSNLEDNCYFPVYNVKDRTNIIVFRNVKFSEVLIGIPRCKSCKKVHSTASTMSNISLFIGIPLVFIIPIYFCVQFDLGTVGMIVLMVMTFGLTYLAMVGIEKAILNSNDVKSKKEGALLEPLIRSFLKTGWSIERPSA